MAKTSVISARIDPDLKQNVEQVFQELGLTTAQAITLFYKQVYLLRGLPFAVKLPNETTQQALSDVKTGRGLTRFDDTESLFEDLDI